jgi:hypothetical protein
MKTTVCAFLLWLAGSPAFGYLIPYYLRADPAGSRVLEVGETAVIVPNWINFSTAVWLGGAGVLSNFTGPGGATYTIVDDYAIYPATGPMGIATCSDCYSLRIDAAVRPAQHWDASVHESLAGHTWSVHVGGSFTDVPLTSPFYRFIEAILHKDVTGGCTADGYCPASPTTREAMAVFLLVAREPRGYTPPACTASPFLDVPASSPFCRWVAELVRRGVTGGCGGGNYCPQSAVSREQMAVFTLRTQSGITPPACTTDPYLDVPASSPFCRWIRAATSQGIVSGCGGGNYCPTAAVTRGQMSVFLVQAFRLFYIL